MEYANSGNLREYLKNNPLNWEDESQKNQKYQLAFDITNGLYYLHKENILHRYLVSYFFLY
jgi:serine/threonine protein kinase